jgi:hypothetical protein
VFSLTSRFERRQEKGTAKARVLKAGYSLLVTCRSPEVEAAHAVDLERQQVGFRHRVGHRGLRTCSAERM